MATVPARPALRPLPASRLVALARRSGTASCRLLSWGAPLKSTVTSCIVPFGAIMVLLVTTPATWAIRAWFRPSVRAPTRARSAAVSRAPSARRTTKTLVASAFCGNARVARSCAFIDSYDLGRKLVWSELETLESDGESATIATAPTTQAAITHQGRRVTNRPSRENTRQTSWTANRDRRISEI